MGDMWQNVDKTRPDSGDYAVLGLTDQRNGMGVLREIFPNGEANYLNFVLFSTSGVHGTYNTIEEAEARVNGDMEACRKVTFLIIHPRLVTLRYGICEPETQDDIDFLKKLRASSHDWVANIGLHFG